MNRASMVRPKWRMTLYTLLVTGCDFMDLGKAQITLEPEVEAALVFGNRLREKQLITNRAGSCAQITMNVVSRK